MKKCPICNISLNDNATSCNHCGVDLQNINEIRSRKNQSNNKILISLLLVACVFLLLGVLSIMIGSIGASQNAQVSTDDTEKSKQTGYSSYTYRSTAENVSVSPKDIFCSIAKKQFGDRLYKAEWNEFDNYGEGNHVVWFRTKAIWSMKDLVNTAAMDIESFLKDLHLSGGIKKPKAITFLVMTESLNKYGDGSLEKILNISFMGEDILKVNWGNITSFSLLDLAASATPSNKIGSEALTAHIADPDNATLTPKFNRMVLEKSLR